MNERSNEYNNKKELLSKLSLDDFNNLNLQKDNLAYFLKKFIIKNEKDRIYIGKLISDEKTIKLDNIKELDKIAQNISYTNDYIKAIENYCEDLNLELLNKIEKKFSYKLVIGLGDPSVTETAITLHHTYGVPYIPGQALKGSARNYFLESYYNIEAKRFIDEESYNLDLKITYRNMYKYIFGDDIHGEDNEKGAVIFFDTFPLNKVNIEKDVMTPHYGNYYRNGQDPIDEFSPNPISFYTIKNTQFNFMIAINKNKLNLDYDKYQYLKKFTIGLFKSMLEEHGIGAKTALGYGYF